MKARSIGFSEINASLSARLYTINRGSRVMITCFKDDYIKTTLKELFMNLKLMVLLIVF